MPGDARAEAVEAMQWRLRQPFDVEDPAQVATLLDAIPTGVLARLAIERGGMEQVGWQRQRGDLHRTEPPAHRRNEETPVYHLTEETGDA